MVLTAEHINQLGESRPPVALEAPAMQHDVKKRYEAATRSRELLSRPQQLEIMSVALSI